MRGPSISITPLARIAGVLLAGAVLASAAYGRPDLPGKGRGKPGAEPPMAHNESVEVRVGGYFDDKQRRVAAEYYGGEKAKGHCPPGLAKKNNGCLPPGLAKKWARGQSLPGDVVFYPLPSVVAAKIGTPPAGYKYVRVANDILLIAVGTSMVVDAIEDLMR
jgi:Ni/Co efflux regulator RcnB